METRTYKELEKEEQSVYSKIIEFVKDKPIKEKQKFCELLSEYIDVQIELEKFCNM